MNPNLWPALLGIFLCGLIIGVAFGDSSVGMKKHNDRHDDDDFHNGWEEHKHGKLTLFELFIIKILGKIMASIKELTAKVDFLQEALDAEQEEIKAAIDALKQLVADLQSQVADGGTAQERQALADKLDAITADLEGTIAASDTTTTSTTTETTTTEETTTI